MPTEIPPELLQQLPSSLLKYAPHIWIALFILRRGWANWRAGNGWYGFKKAFLGEKTSDAKAKDNAKDDVAMEKKRGTQAPFETE
jgi:hypothetical protein